MTSATILRRPADPFGDLATKRVLDFMSEHGKTGYAKEINELQSQFDEVQAEAGPNGYLCPDTQAWLDEIDRAIWEVAQAATDRYDDWASDPLP